MNKDDIKDIYKWTKYNGIDGMFYIDLKYVKYEILLTEWDFDSDNTTFLGVPYGQLFIYEKTPQYGCYNCSRYTNNINDKLDNLLEIAYKDAIYHYPELNK